MMILTRTATSLLTLVILQCVTAFLVDRSERSVLKFLQEAPESPEVEFEESMVQGIEEESEENRQSVPEFAEFAEEGAPEEECRRSVLQGFEEGSEHYPYCRLASPCDSHHCRPPCCFCSGTDNPGGLPVRQVPQIVSLTFHSGINVLNYAAYNELFRARKNPNNCSMAGTFYVMHEYTDYTLAHKLYEAQHELGVNGITWEWPVEYWRNASVKDWVDEIGGDAQILSRFGNISFQSIRGMRSPYLQMGANNQMTAMQHIGLLYDSTWVTGKFIDSPNLLWPYTLDYASIQDCPIGNCPNCSFPGTWEVPIFSFRCPNGQLSATADGCTGITNQKQAFYLLLDKLHTHYTSTNRAPMVVSLGSEWVQTDYKLKATKQFLDFVGRFNDIYVLPAGKIIDWMKKPTPVAQLPNFKPWMCKDVLNECSGHTRCLYDQDRRLITRKTCLVRHQMDSCVKQCPRCYPWIHDPYGLYC